MPGIMYPGYACIAGCPNGLIISEPYAELGAMKLCGRPGGGGRTWGGIGGA
jgi:hypothetical protein